MTAYKSVLVMSLILAAGCAPEPGSSAVMLEHARLLRFQEKYNEADEFLQTAIKSHPTNAELHYERALSYAAAEKTDLAIAEYEAAIKLNADYLEAHNNRAVLLAQQGRFEEAVAGFSETVRLNSDEVMAYSNRGRANLDGGNYDAAIRDLSIAVNKDPAEIENWLMRGMACAYVEYENVIVAGVKWPLAKAAYWFNQNVLDGIVNAVGAATKRTGGWVYRNIDQRVVDGAVNASGTAASESGHALQPVQSGKVNQYGALLFGAAGIGAILLIILNG